MLNNEFPPLGGGTGIVNRAILLRLAQIPGLEIDLITSVEGKHPVSTEFAEHIRILKVPVDRFNIHHASNRELLTYAWRSFWLALQLYRIKPYDLCFAWSAVPAGGVALALRALVGLKYMVRVCGPDIPGFEQRYQSIYLLLTPIIRSIWHGAQIVIAKCDGEAELVHQIDPKVKIAIVPNGVDSGQFLPQALEQAVDPLRLICVGRLIERKGQRFIIQAVDKLVKSGVDVTLDLIGTGDAENDYRELASSLGIADRLRFNGYVPHERIAQAYAASHVFVLASFNEGMSVATLEAMAAGLPIVVTRTGGTKELVVEGENGWSFAWGDVDALVTRLTHLADDRLMLKRMGEASRQRAMQFTWDAAATHYRELLGLAQGEST